MSRAFGIAPEWQAPVSYFAGGVEVLFGLCVLLLPRRAWPQWVSAASMAILLVFAALYTPHYLVGAFNPVVMNVASIVLSIVALLALRAEASKSD